MEVRGHCPPPPHNPAPPFSLITGHSSISDAVAWLSGSALVSINEVTLHRAQLVPGWVTAFGRHTISVILTCDTGQQPPAHIRMGIR